MTMIRKLLQWCGLITVLVLAVGSAAVAEIATEQEMSQVCQNWLVQSVAEQGAWAGTDNPSILDSRDLSFDGRVVAKYYNIEPEGFVIVPVLKEMMPVKVYSDKGYLDAIDAAGFLDMVGEMIWNRQRAYEGIYGSLDAVQPDGPEVLFAVGQRESWDKFAVSTEQFKRDLSPSAALGVDDAGPLLISSWHQRAPYNNYCPDGDGDRTVVGCVATAAAQILDFWEWPESGIGDYSYYWEGDNSCGGSTPGQTLYADFSDPYDWANIVDSCDEGCTPEQEAALAELNYEVGVAFSMDYGACGSGAYVTPAAYLLPTFFKYSWDATVEYRTDHSLYSWFQTIQEEINAGRPIDYCISRHSIVCDGWRDSGSRLEYHMNYGWGGNHTAWYILDSLYCYWEPDSLCPWEVEHMVTHIEPQTTPVLSCGGKVVTDPAGDGDGHADPAETCQLSVIVCNNGFDAENVEGALVSLDPMVTVTAAAAGVSAMIPWGGETTFDTPFELSIDGACSDPHIAFLELTTTSHPEPYESLFVFVDTFMLFIGDTEGFSDSLNGGEGDWAHFANTVGYYDEWHLETYRHHTGSTSWKCGGPGSMDYGNSLDAALVTPPFLLPSNAELTFWHWIDAEPADGTEAWDGGTVMISIEGGQWTQIMPEGGYPYTIAQNAASPFAGGTPAYGWNHDWSQAEFDLSAYSGVAQIMFRFGTDGNTIAEGWYVDDINVASAGCCGVYTGGYTGNCNCDVDGKRDLADISKLIDRVYLTKNPLCCEENGDTNADTKINLADISRLIDHVYLTKTETEPCP